MRVSLNFFGCCKVQQFLDTVQLLPGCRMYPLF
jgi:hypothetical protein